MTSREARYLVSTLPPSRRQGFLEDIQLKCFIHSELFNKEIVDHRLYLFIVAELKGEIPKLIEPHPARHRAERMPSMYLLPGQVLGASV